MSILTWPVATGEYLTSLRAAGRSPGTIRVHKHYLGLLTQYADSPHTITIQAMERVLSHPGWAAETRKSCRGVFSSFCKWLHGMGYIPANPALLLGTVRVPDPCPRPIPEPVFARALALANTRERWILLLGAHAGMRAAEIAAVHRDDLDGDLLYVTGKGGRRRVVPLTDDDLMHAIRTADPWLFPGRTDGHLSSGHVTVLMSRLLPDHWTTHTLRHRAATVGYEATGDLLAVGRYLGHARPETTIRYVQMPLDNLRAVARATA